ncbi:MAG: hypothetical protein IPJ61_17775 [Tessaracoccus sp.]|uniref:hypothetical protein n=1 Tax=Tessaracoccus sp. TaxID=1971211 RepID=UPI001EC89F53|nr:hypothetical protein [Tessaracoccus sp.]MBK7822854.1 hypothetical protein [Tessaracoccus sp.]
MRITAEPRSDQINADDLVGGPRIVTVAGVRVGTAEQKYDILLVGEERVWRPPLTVLRLLIAAWGDDATAWVGRRAELYRDPAVRFGSDAVGGIRVSRLSHIGKRLSVALTATRGKRTMHMVDPLPDEPATPALTDAEIDAATTTDGLRALWSSASPEQQERIKARVAELGGAA